MGVLAIDECWVAVGVEPPVDILADESVLAAARLYRPGEAFTGASSNERERSGMAVDKVMPVKSPIGLMSISSFEPCARERLDEPDVDTVESEEEEGWVGWPRRACWRGGCGCCCCWGDWGFGDDTERVSCRSWGVLEKAYGAMGAEVPL